MTFDQAMQSSGLIPGAIVPDGRWRRCKTTDKAKRRNGAYVLYPDGRGYWINWAIDVGVNEWSDEAVKARTPTAAELARRESQRQHERERRANAILGARARWNESAPMRDLHPYLGRKGLGAAGCTGLRVWRELLVVPVYFGDSITSIQTIDHDGQKRFWPGAPVKAGAYVMRRPRSAVTAVCEGLATGLAIYQSLRHASVVVAFDAGNLVRAVDRLRPTGSVVICADNDHATQGRTGINPGIQKAENAAELIGAGVAYPQGIKGTDWADALAEGWSASKIERAVMGKAKYVT